MKKIFLLSATALFIFSPFSAFASETRVDSTGGLSLLMTDETVELNPFSLGNPAGLALLPPKNRLDWNGEWLDQSGDFFLKTSDFYGTLNDPNNSLVNYHGFIFFPADRWALQLDGDVFQNDQNQNVGLITQGLNETRELFRTAYNFGLFVLGAEFHPQQSTYHFNRQEGFGVQLQGTGSATNWNSTAGLLMRFPQNPRPDADRFTLGGVYSTDPAPAEASLKLSVDPSGSLTANFKELSSHSFGPDLYFDSPGSLQAALIARFVDSSNSLQTDSTVPALVIPAFKYEAQTQTVVAGGFKENYSLEKALDLKSGLFLDYKSGSLTTYKQDGTVNSTSPTQDWEIQGGIGLGKKDDYTLGIQMEVDRATGSLEPTGGPASSIDFFGYKISIGGEKWLSPQWAFRMGTIFEDDLNNGQGDYSTYYLTIPAGQRVVEPTLTAGLGYKDPGFYLDLMVSYGQPSLYDGPQSFGSQAGIQLAGGIQF